MDFGLEIIFRHMPEMKDLRHYIERQVQALDRNFEGIESCRVAIELPYHHRYQGNLYKFQIEVMIPGKDIVVTRNPSADGADLDVFAMVGDAFSELDRNLRSCACARVTETGEVHLFERTRKVSQLEKEPRTMVG